MAMAKPGNLRISLSILIGLICLCLKINEVSSRSIVPRLGIKGQGRKAIEVTGGEFLEHNPDYFSGDEYEVTADTDFEHDDDSEDDDYDSDDATDDITDDDESKSKTKSSINKALSNKSLSSTLKKSIQFAKNHQHQITVALILFAFRNEIRNILLKAFFTTTTTSSPDGQPIIRRRLKFSLNPTSILKLIIFFDLLRKMQSGGSNYSHDGTESGELLNPGAAARGGPFGIGILLHKFLFPQSNNAFLPPVVQHYTFERMNNRFQKDGLAWKKAITTGSGAGSTSLFSSPQPSSSSLSSTRSIFSRSKSNSTIVKNPSSSTDNSINQSNKTTIIFEMKGLDTSISRMDTIRDKISFLLHQHRSMNTPSRMHADQTNNNTTATGKDNEENEAFDNGNSSRSTDTTNHPLKIQNELEVVILLESPGGSASDYGLAANQIGRLRDEPGIKVTICVDKVAASGGYMIACMSSPGQLFASPFAMLGSIGVIGQTLNIHNTLQNWGVKPLVFRGGKDKAPIGLVGEITEEGMAKVQDMVDKTHLAFKHHVTSARPNLTEDIDTIATGDVWLGADALELGLIDRITTSDEYLWEKIHAGERVLKLVTFERPRFLFGPPSGQGIPGGVQTLAQSLCFNILSKNKLFLQRLLLGNSGESGEVNGCSTMAQDEVSVNDLDISKIVAACDLGIQHTQIYAKSDY